MTDHVRFIVDIYTRVRGNWIVTASGYPTSSEAMIAGRHLAERAEGVVISEFTIKDAELVEHRVLARFGKLPLGV